MNLSACRIVRTNNQIFHSTSVEEALKWLDEHNDVARVEVDAIDNKATIHFYMFNCVDESIESLMNL